MNHASVANTVSHLPNFSRFSNLTCTLSVPDFFHTHALPAWCTHVFTFCSDPKEFMKCMFGPVIELTHNHGTETQADFKYHNGNDQDAGQLRGFGHLGFLVDDLEAACTHLEDQGVAFKKKPLEGTMRGLAFAYDTPSDNYWIEIIQRKGIDLVAQSQA